MKKWLLITGIFLSAILIFLYVFIPNRITLNQTVLINAPQQGVYRQLFENKNWPKWWPASSGNPDTLLRYNGLTYSLHDKQLSSFVISIADDTQKLHTSLNLLSASTDSTVLEWKTTLPTSYNPFARLRAYFKAKKIGESNAALLKTLQAYYSNPKNIYGIDIAQVPITDSILVSTYAITRQYPTTDFVYRLIGELTDYIQQQAAIQTGYPMLNVSTNDSIEYLVKVAVPVDRVLPATGNITYKFMPGRKRILTTEVKGGPAAIASVFPAFENYIRDYRQSSPAIPFLSLVTDRSKQPDSSNWVTKIYYPVMLW